MTGAELLVRCLEAEGITSVFGIPGEENADMMFALHDSPIDVVLTRHEQAAAFMADVAGRVTGEPGVCFGTLGPGATNLVTGVTDANLDRSPVVVITGQASTYRTHRESHQNVHVVDLFKPVCKLAVSIEHPDIVPEVVRHAFQAALAPKPGACHIELPEDVAGAPADPACAPLPRATVSPPQPAPDAIARAADAILAAREPVILAGNGVLRDRASQAVRDFAHATGISVANTFMAKGVLSRSDPASLFTIGLQARDLVLREFEQADLVITIGFDMIEYEPRLWNTASKPIVHIDDTPAVAEYHYPIAVEVVGDIGAGVAALSGKIRERCPDPPFSLDRIAGIRDAMTAEFEMYADDDTTGTIRPQKVVADLEAVLGPDDLVLADVGAHKMWMARHYHCDTPNSCLFSNGFCSMGFALPGAIAAAYLRPESRVVAVCGDAGFLMNVQEMETARRLGVSPTVLVWEDNAFGLIKWKQKTKTGRHTDLGFTNPDWGMLGAAFGWSVAAVEDAHELRPALEDALSRPTPSLVTIPIDYRENYLLTERLGELMSRL